MNVAFAPPSLPLPGIEEVWSLAETLHKESFPRNWSPKGIVVPPAPPLFPLARSQGRGYVFPASRGEKPLSHFR